MFAPRSAPPVASPSTLRLLRLSAALTVVNLAWQFVTAGRLFPGPVTAHAAGAIVLHVVSGIAMIAAAVHRHRTRTTPWVAVLALVVFVLTFVQAATGGRSTLAVHVPGAMLLVVGAVWVLVWSLGGSTRPHVSD